MNSADFDQDYESHWEKLASGSIVTSSTPEELWQLACLYFLWCDKHPIKTKQTVINGKNSGNKMEVESVRPYTLQGLCLHCGIDVAWLNDIQANKNSTSEYVQTINRILYVIRTQHMEYAMVGIFNPIFTGKVLGVEKEEEPTGSIRVELVGYDGQTLASSENEILDKLNKENGFPENPKEQNL